MWSNPKEYRYRRPLSTHTNSVVWPGSANQHTRLFVKKWFRIRFHPPPYALTWLLRTPVAANVKITISNKQRKRLKFLSLDAYNVQFSKHSFTRKIVISYVRFRHISVTASQSTRNWLFHQQVVEANNTKVLCEGNSPYNGCRYSVGEVPSLSEPFTRDPPTAMCKATAYLMTNYMLNDYLLTSDIQNTIRHL